MSEITFEAWPKTPRLFKESMVITEKIDGTNSAVGVQEFPFGWHVGGVDEQGVSHDPPENAVLVMGPPGEDGLPDLEYLVYAQSRNRVITPATPDNKAADNYGFAGWVWANADELARILGPGLHFGEYWGHGIGRGYELAQGERYFSLFNTSRWKHLAVPEARAEIKPPEALRVVPVLSVHTLDTDIIRETLDALKFTGSHAAPGYENPEGICVYLPAARATFKVTFDDEHKSQQAKALAEAGA